MLFSDMVSYVSKRVIDPNNTAVSVADVQQAINDAISYYANTRFYFNEVYDQATLTAQSPLFPYPAGFLVPSMDDDGFNIQWSNRTYPLAKGSMQQYDSWVLNNGYGLPRWYAPGPTLTSYVCYPIPDQNYTVGRHYLIAPSVLVNPTDSNVFSINAGRMVCLRATATILSEFREDDTRATALLQAANDEYRNQLKLSNQSNATGKLTIYA